MHDGSFLFEDIAEQVGFNIFSLAVPISECAACALIKVNQASVSRGFGNFSLVRVRVWEASNGKSWIHSSSLLALDPS